MNAIESSSELFRHICQLTETKIADHFAKVDQATDKTHVSDVLRITELSDEIAGELEVKQTEALYSIYLYLRFRPDLEIRSGKNGGICRRNDDRVKTAMTPRECALKFYDVVKSCALEVIDNGFRVAEDEARAQGQMANKVRLNFQDLCSEIGVKMNIKPYAVYHCLKKYVEEERRDLSIGLGRQGGLMKK